MGSLPIKQAIRTQWAEVPQQGSHALGQGHPKGAQRISRDQERLHRKNKERHVYAEMQRMNKCSQRKAGGKEDNGKGAGAEEGAGEEAPLSSSDRRSTDAGVAFTFQLLCVML